MFLGHSFLSHPTSFHSFMVCLFSGCKRCSGSSKDTLEPVTFRRQAEDSLERVVGSGSIPLHVCPRVLPARISSPAPGPAIGADLYLHLSTSFPVLWEKPGTQRRTLGDFPSASPLPLPRAWSGSCREEQRGSETLLNSAPTAPSPAPQGCCRSLDCPGVCDLCLSPYLVFLSVSTVVTSGSRVQRPVMSQWHSDGPHLSRTGSSTSARLRLQ